MNYYSGDNNPYDGVPFGPRLWRRNRSSNLPPTTIRNRYNRYDHQNSNSHPHSLNASNHHQQQQQIVPFYNNAMIWEAFDSSNHLISRGYILQSQETIIILNEHGEIQEWYYVYDALVRDDTVEGQSTSNNQGLSEEGISKCLKLIKTKGDSEEGICVIRQDDLFPHEEEQEEENHRQKVAAISPCGHEYHYDCVAKWLQQKDSCPLCKATPTS